MTSKKFGILRCVKCETTYAVHCSMCKPGEIAQKAYEMVCELDDCREYHRRIQWCWEEDDEDVALDIFLEVESDDRS